MGEKAKIKYVGEQKCVINKFGKFEKGKEVEVEGKVALVLNKSSEFELIGETKPAKPNKTEDK